MKNRFSKGDSVRIAPLTVLLQKRRLINDTMRGFAGQKTVIKSLLYDKPTGIDTEDAVTLEIDGGKYGWRVCLLEPTEEEQEPITEDTELSSELEKWCKEQLGEMEK